MGGYVINTSRYTPQDIVAIEPCYGHQGGNATRIYTRHGKVYEDNRRLQTVLKGTVSYYDADLAMLRKNYKDYLDCSQGIPLPLTPQLVLVPLKMRSALSRKDGATGYVNLCDIKEITADDTQPGGEAVKCRLLLSGGHSLPSLYNLKSTKKRLNYGRQALVRHCSLKSSCLCGTPESLTEQALAEVQKKLFSITKLFYELLTDYNFPSRKMGF